MIERWGSNNGPSAVVEHGANPGMVSHLVKRALVDITTALLKDGKAGSRATALQAALDAEQFNVLAQLTGTKSFILLNAIRKSPTSQKKSTSFATRGQLKVSTKKALRQQSLVGAHTKSGCQRTHTRITTMARATKYALHNLEWKPGCAAGCQAGKTSAWLFVTASRTPCANTSR